MKSITIMQSDYLPGIFRFEMMALAQEYVLYDSVAYTQGWRNRNKIRVNCERGWAWLTVPLVAAQTQKKELIQNIHISTNFNWKRKHLRSLFHSYVNSPYFHVHRNFFEQMYARDWKFLTEINEHVINYIRDYLGFTCKVLRVPSSWPDSSTISEPNERRVQNLIAICLAREAEILLVGPSTYNYCQPLLSKFAESGIKVRLVNPMLKTYQQRYTPFIPGLSIIDLLFNEPKEKAIELLRDRQASLRDKALLYCDFFTS